MKPAPIQKNKHTFSFTKEVFPIKEVLSCFKDNTIDSLTCVKGSGIFTKKPSKKAKECPLDGALEPDGEDKSVYQKDGNSNLMKCSNEAVHIGKTSQDF